MGVGADGPVISSSRRRLGSRRRSRLSDDAAEARVADGCPAGGLQYGLALSPGMSLDPPAEPFGLSVSGGRVEGRQETAEERRGGREEETLLNGVLFVLLLCVLPPEKEDFAAYQVVLSTVHVPAGFILALCSVLCIPCRIYANNSKDRELDDTKSCPLQSRTCTPQWYQTDNSRLILTQ